MLGHLYILISSSSQCSSFVSLRRLKQPTCMRSVLYFLFFFFQAEDGIRDDLVTGVQTCALPISDGTVWAWGHNTAGRIWSERPVAQLTGGVVAPGPHGAIRGECQTVVVPRRDREDRESVVEGKRGELGGCRIIKKKKKG